jgi:hypothetical protein
MTAHLVRPGDQDHDASSTACVRRTRPRFGINHPTLQIERGAAASTTATIAPRMAATEGPGPAGVGLSLYFGDAFVPEPTMISDIHKDAQTRMAKSVEACATTSPRSARDARRRRWSSTLKVNYYGADMPLSQVASIAVHGSRSLTITPWEKQMVSPVEKAILASDLGLTPNNRRHRDPHQPACAHRRTSQGTVQARHGAARTRRSPSATSGAMPTITSRNC